jgi:transposase
METGKRVFTTEFKRDALDLVERSGKSLAQVARELGISDNTLQGWKQQMRAHGTDAFPGSGHQTPKARRAPSAQTRKRDLTSGT